jgi:hypothetical protein
MFLDIDFVTLSLSISFFAPCLYVYQAVLSNSDLLTAVLRTEEEPLTVIQQRSVGGKKL